MKGLKYIFVFGFWLLAFGLFGQEVQITQGGGDISLFTSDGASIVSGDTISSSTDFWFTPSNSVAGLNPLNIIWIDDADAWHPAYIEPTLANLAQYVVAEVRGGDIRLMSQGRINVPSGAPDGKRWTSTSAGLTTISNPSDTVQYVMVKDGNWFDVNIDGEANISDTTLVVMSASPPDERYVWIDTSSIDATGTEAPVMKYINSSWISVGYYNLFGDTYSALAGFDCRCDGQSNMIGSNETPKNETAENLASDNRVLVWNPTASSWGVADIAATPFNGQNNLCFQFAKEMARKENRTVRVIMNAVGGIPIAYWDPRPSAVPPAGSYWESGQEQCEESGVEKLDAFLWYQGEANDGGSVGAYQLYWDLLIDSLNEQSYFDSHNSTMVLAAEIAGSSDSQNEVITSFNNDTITHIAYVPTKDLEIWDGGNHISSTAATELGKRFYSLYRALPYHKNSYLLRPELADSLSNYLPLAGGTMTGDINMGNVGKLIGGTSDVAGLAFQTTTGNGAGGSDFRFLVGNNGADTALTITYNGLFGFGETNPSDAFIDMNFVGGLNLPVVKYRSRLSAYVKIWADSDDNGNTDSYIQYGQGLGGTSSVPEQSFASGLDVNKNAFTIDYLLDGWATPGIDALFEVHHDGEFVLPKHTSAASFPGTTSHFNTQAADGSILTKSATDFVSDLGLSGLYFEQNGNSFGSPAILGTNDNQSLSLETNNSTRLTLTTNGLANFFNSVAGSGNVVTFNSSDQPTAGEYRKLAIQYSAATLAAFASLTESAGNYSACLYSTGSGVQNSEPGLQVKSDNSVTLPGYGYGKIQSDGNGNLTSVQDTITIKLTPISKSTAITSTGELEGDYFVIDDRLAGYSIESIEYAILSNTATSGTLQIGLRRYTASNTFSSTFALSTFTTSDTRITNTSGLTVVDGDYYILYVNAESFDNNAEGVTATISFVK